MRLAVIGPTLEFGKGSYILKSLGKQLESTNLQVSYLGYHDVILNTSRMYLKRKQLYYKVQPIIYKNSFRRGIRLLRTIIEKSYFVKYIVKNFDCVLASVTALEFLGVSKLAEKNFPIIFWDMDSPNIPYERYAKFIKDNHILLCYSKGGQKIWSEHGIESYFLPLACDTNIFYPINNAKKIEILFTGRYLRDRIHGYREYLYPLIEYFGRKVVIVGDGWKNNRYVSKATVLPGVPYQVLNKIYNMAKICRNIHRDETRNCHSAFNLRLFESMGAKQFTICDYILGIDEFFHLSRELIVCEDGKRLIEEVKFYLENEEDRNSIAQAGYEKILKEHTIRRRAQQVRKIIIDKLV
ncbi:MAG: glycosyltransferase [bacterium]|nr:glycosyltransferase [bacterium]